MTVFWLKHRGTIYPVSANPVVLGRSPQASLVVISDERVSRRHAVVRDVEGTLTIEDLNSRNGTFVDGRRIHEKTVLKAGSVISIGGERLEVVCQVSQPFSQTVDSALHDDVATVTEKNALGVVEDLMARAVRKGHGPKTADAVREMIDSVLASANGSLSREEALRIASAAKTVAEWYPDGSSDAWRDSILERTSPITGMR
jgi:predicted component of type VI protein secretion system